MSTLLHKCSVICNDYCSVHEMTMLINTKISCIVLADLHSKCAYKTLLKVLALFKCQHFHTQLYTTDIQKDNRACQKPSPPCCLCQRCSPVYIGTSIYCAFQ